MDMDTLVNQEQNGRYILRLFFSSKEEGCRIALAISAEINEGKSPGTVIISITANPYRIFLNVAREEIGSILQVLDKIFQANSDFKFEFEIIHEQEKRIEELL